MPTDLNDLAGAAAGAAGVEIPTDMTANLGALASQAGLDASALPLDANALVNAAANQGGAADLNSLVAAANASDTVNDIAAASQ